MSKPTYETILQQPLATVRAAYEQLLGGTFTTKQAAAADLASAVTAGRVTLDQIRASIPRRPPGAPSAPVVHSSAAITSDLISDLKRDSQGLTGRVDALVDNVSRVSTGLDSVVRGLNQLHSDGAARDADLADRLSTLEQAARHAAGVDAGAVDAAIQAAVADGFSAFKRKIEKAGLEQAAADAVAVRVVERRSALDVFGIDLYDTQGNTVMVDLYDHPAAPSIDPNFIWTESILRHLLLSQTTQEHVWFGGAKGAGKTETAKQFAARTGRGYVRINFHKYSTSDEYLGCTGLVNGATEFVDGDFLRAYATPSTVILLDEISNCAPGELAPLNALLEPAAAVTIDRKSTRLNSSHVSESRMPSSA